MLNTANLNWTHRRVLRAIRELSRDGHRVTYDRIAGRAECSYTTVRRAVAELQREGKIELVSKGKGCGYIFRVNP